MSKKRLSDGKTSQTKNATCFSTQKIVDVRRLREFLEVHRLLESQYRRYMEILEIIHAIKSDYKLLKSRSENYRDKDLKEIIDSVCEETDRVIAPDDEALLQALNKIRDEISESLADETIRWPK